MISHRIFVRIFRGRIISVQVSFPLRIVLLLITHRIGCLLPFPFNTNHSFYGSITFRLDFKRGYNLWELIVQSFDGKGDHLVDDLKDSLRLVL